MDKFDVMPISRLRRRLVYILRMTNRHSEFISRASEEVLRRIPILINPDEILRYGVDRDSKGVSEHSAFPWVLPCMEGILQPTILGNGKGPKNGQLPQRKQRPLGFERSRRRDTRQSLPFPLRRRRD